MEKISLFIERTGAPPDIAHLYLEDSHFQFERALERYLLETSTTTDMLEIRPHAVYVENSSQPSTLVLTNPIHIRH